MQTVHIHISKRPTGKEAPRTTSFPYEFPESVEEAKSVYGEDLTLRFITTAMTQALRPPAQKILGALPLGTPESYAEGVSAQMAGYTIAMKQSRRPSTPKLSVYQQVVADLGDPEKREEILQTFRSLGYTVHANGHDKEAQERETLPEERETLPEEPEALKVLAEVSPDEEYSTSRRRR